MADNFFEVIKENSVQGRTKTTFNQWCLFAASGVVMAVMPAYIYASPMFDVPLYSTSHSVSLVSAVLLTWAYRSVSLQRRINALATHQIPATKKDEKVAKKEREEAHAAFEQKTADLCCAYALFKVNATFVGLWLFFAFYAIPKFATDVAAKINHLVAVLGPALLLGLKATAVF